MLHTALSSVYTLHELHCKKFATNHLRFFSLSFFAKFPLGPNSFISDICSRVCVCMWGAKGAWEWVRQWQSRGREGNNLCWCVSANAVRECQAIEEYDELYAKKTTPKYIFCTKNLKSTKCFQQQQQQRQQQNKLNHLIVSPKCLTLPLYVCVCVCICLARTISNRYICNSLMHVWRVELPSNRAHLSSDERSQFQMLLPATQKKKRKKQKICFPRFAFLFCVEHFSFFACHKTATWRKKSTR